MDPFRNGSQPVLSQDEDFVLLSEKRRNKAALAEMELDQTAVANNDTNPVSSTSGYFGSRALMTPTKNLTIRADSHRNTSKSVSNTDSMIYENPKNFHIISERSGRFESDTSNHNELPIIAHAQEQANMSEMAPMIGNDGLKSRTLLSLKGPKHNKDQHARHNHKSQQHRGGGGAGSERSKQGSKKSKNKKNKTHANYVNMDQMDASAGKDIGRNAGHSGHTGHSGDMIARSQTFDKKLERHQRLSVSTKSKSKSSADIYGKGEFNNNNSSNNSYKGYKRKFGGRVGYDVGGMGKDAEVSGIAAGEDYDEDFDYNGNTPGSEETLEKMAVNTPCWVWICCPLLCPILTVWYVCGGLVNPRCWMMFQVVWHLVLDWCDEVTDVIFVLGLYDDGKNNNLFEDDRDFEILFYLFVGAVGVNHFFNFIYAIYVRNLWRFDEAYLQKYPHLRPQIKRMSCGVQWLLIMFVGVLNCATFNKFNKAYYIRKNKHRINLIYIDYDFPCSALKRKKYDNDEYKAYAARLRQLDSTVIQKEFTNMLEREATHAPGLVYVQLIESVLKFVCYALLCVDSECLGSDRPTLMITKGVITLVCFIVEIKGCAVACDDYSFIEHYSDVWPDEE